MLPIQVATLITAVHASVLSVTPQEKENSKVDKRYYNELADSVANTVQHQEFANYEPVSDDHYGAAPAYSEHFEEPVYGQKERTYGGAYKCWKRPYEVFWEQITIRRTVEPVDPYWEGKVAPDETIRATCEFDFLGNSFSSGSLELVQKPGYLVSIIGEFEGLSPGGHALKIHDFGDLEYGCESPGKVYNPFGVNLGYSHHDMTKRRVGDLEYVWARFDTNAEYKNRDLLA